MLNDGKILATILATIISILAVWNSNSSELIEPFQGMPQRAVNFESVAVYPDGSEVAISNQDQMRLAQFRNMYQVPGTFQSNISPRFDGTNNYGAYLRDNLPYNQVLAVPNDPLNRSSENYTPKFDESMFIQPGKKENFVNYQNKNDRPSNDPMMFSKLGQGAVLPPDYALNSYKKAKESLPVNNVTSELPVPDMTVMNSENNGESNVYIIDRPFYSNLKSRLASRGDYIRGDVPPICDEGAGSQGWFQVSKKPNLDLNQGAMFVMGGVNNETANELYALQNTYSKGSRSGFAGLNMHDVAHQEQFKSANIPSYSQDRQNSMQMNTQIGSTYNALSGDIQYTAFP